MRPDTVEVNRHGAALWMLCALTAPALGATDGRGVEPSDNPRRLPASPGSAADLLDFDIPAQPLVGALSQYAFLTRQPALYASDLALGRTSSAVRGRYAPEAALQRLLAGTGLVAEKARTAAGDTFVLTQPHAQAVDRPRMTALLGERPGYAGLIQARIWQALCADARTMPGRYSSLLRFRVDTDGRIRDARLLDSTGDAERDGALLAALRGVSIDEPPPPALARQSLTMAVLPDGPDAGPQCAGQGEGG